MRSSDLSQTTFFKHRGPYNTCDQNLFTGIIIFPDLDVPDALSWYTAQHYIDNTQ